MKLITFTHANTKKEAYIVKEKIFGFHFSEAHQCVLLLSDAGGVFPVKETEEEIKKLLTPQEEQ